MTLVALNEDVWADTYTWIDEGLRLDQHRRTMPVIVPEQSPFAYHRVNMYTWPNGQAKTEDFKIRYVEGFHLPLL